MHRGSGTTSLTITGSLSQVNADLATLSDTDPSSGSDTITLTAKDSFGNSAQQQTIAVTASGGPVLTVPGAQTVGLNHATAIAGVSLAESGSSSDETFTVTLTDTHGQAVGERAGVSGSGTTKLTHHWVAGAGECGPGDAERHGSEQRFGHDHADGEGQLRQQCPAADDRGDGERRAGADGAGCADGWAQPCDGDRRGEPGGERQQR